jgi:hypothetical protein
MSKGHCPKAPKASTARRQLKSTLTPFLPESDAQESAAPISGGPTDTQ